MKNLVKAAFLFCGLIGGFNHVILFTVAEEIAGPHGGQIVHKPGGDYEVVNNIQENRIQVYASGHTSPELPSAVVVKVKRNDAIIDRVHLSLTPDPEPNTPAYSAKVPANISISGGITYDLDF